jgi:hypothetical protein
LISTFQIGSIMRTLTLLAILGAAALSAPAFAAPGAVTPDASGNAMVAVQTVAGQRHAVRAGDVDDVVGSYHLSDGQTLRVSYAQRGLFAEIGSTRTELIPAGQRTFVSGNADMKLEFAQLPFADNVAITRRR